MKEEKVYELDVKKKTYEVVTFDELRRRMREARENAEKSAPKEGEAPQQDKPAREMEVDFDVKETGQTRSIAGHTTKEVVMTVTVREKGRALEDGGGMVMTSNSWMAPAIPAMRELSDFELRYWKAIAPEVAGVSAEQMAAVMAMYPMVKQAMERLQAEGTQAPGHSARDDHGVRGGEEQGSGGAGQPAELGRRPGWNARAQDDEERRQAARHRVHADARNARGQPHGRCGGLQLPAGFKEKK